jgi:hypothetical protein
VAAAAAFRPHPRGAGDGGAADGRAPARAPRTAAVRRGVDAAGGAPRVGVPRRRRGPHGRGGRGVAGIPRAGPRVHGHGAGGRQPRGLSLSRPGQPLPGDGAGAVRHGARVPRDGGPLRRDPAPAPGAGPARAAVSRGRGGGRARRRVAPHRPARAAGPRRTTPARG